MGNIIPTNFELFDVIFSTRQRPFSFVVCLGALMKNLTSCLGDTLEKDFKNSFIK